ncbi:MAG: phosphoribosylformimino-5-aminoimidazole carboxamide ribotide isomerase [Eubacteriales bacterium]|nr:phosphoribosylformimino-5-aminoimidazole carboxamide ribotide isomerase [Eubacteriales bacterium]
MRFRPCIDIHNGKVKQIVGGSLVDAGNRAQENFTSEYDGAFYAELYKRDGLAGGHIILLNPPSSEYFEASRKQALGALAAYPDGMQIGGGIRTENAYEYIEAGASHVIVTSYVFRDGRIRWDNLEKLAAAVGREHVVLDLSCRKKEDGDYYIVTNRWQTFTDVKLEPSVMKQLENYCDEFLIHGVDVEGKASGVAEGLVRILGQYHGRTVTYAGGIGTMEELEHFRQLSGGRIDFTIGSALDLFGGNISYEVIKMFR